MEPELIYKLPSHDLMVDAEKKLIKAQQVLSCISEAKRRIAGNETYVRLFGDLYPQLAKKAMHDILISRAAVRRLRQLFNNIINETQI